MEQSAPAVAAIKVYFSSTDPLSEAGMATYLRGHPEVELVPESGMAHADVVLLVADTVDDRTARVLGLLRHDGGPRVLLLVSDIDADGVSAAVQAGAVGILRRSGATCDELLSAIRAAAAGQGILPPDLLGGLLRRVRADDHGADPLRSRPSDRELRVLRLISDGCDTREIARTLCYSERTVKNVVQDLTRRLGLRNRSHAVAY